MSSRPVGNLGIAAPALLAGEGWGGVRHLPMAFPQVFTPPDLPLQAGGGKQHAPCTGESERAAYGANRDQAFLSAAYFASQHMAPATKTCFRQRSKSCNAGVAK